MKTYNNSVVLRNDGVDPSTSNADLNAGTGVNITVRVASNPVAGEGALASIFNVADVAIANPMQTDNQGNYTFKVTDGFYDIVIAEGTADEKIIAAEDISGIIDNLALPYIFDTVAEFKASLIVFPDGKTIIRGYYGAGDTGTATGIIKSATQVSSDGDVVTGLIGQYINIQLASGKYWIYTGDKEISIEQAGALTIAADNYEQMQACADFQWEKNVKVTAGSGVFNTTKPVAVWCDSNEFTDKNPEWSGLGRDATEFTKSTNTTSTITNHTSIDAILMIVNPFSRAGNTITTYTTFSQTGAHKCKINGITLNGIAPSLIDYGFYSYGISFCTFDDMGFKGTYAGMATEYWNQFCNFKRLEMDLVKVGFDFGRTDFGSSSTMLFESIHCRGINVACFSILGTATLINCSIDGGAGSHIVCDGLNRGAAGYLGGRVTLINCHHESPSVATGRSMFFANWGGEIDIWGGSIEIPSLAHTAADSLITLTNYSRLTLSNVQPKFRGGATTSGGSFYDTDNTSRVTMYGSTEVDTEAFDVAKVLRYNSADKNVIADRFLHDEVNYNRYISYVSGAVPAGDRTVTTVSFSSNRVQIGCVQTNGYLMANGVMFPKSIDLTNYAKLYIKGDVDFLEGSGTGNANYQVHINSTLIADGAVGVGTPLSIDYARAASGEVPSNFSAVGFNKYVDVSDINGVYYIGVVLYGQNINSSIQEISLVR